MKELIVRMEDNGQLTPVAELVRCKDCKHNSGYGRGLYSAFCMCYLTGTRHKDTWFCADGKAKEGDQE